MYIISFKPFKSPMLCPAYRSESLRDLLVGVLGICNTRAQPLCITSLIYFCSLRGREGSRREMEKRGFKRIRGRQRGDGTSSLRGCSWLCLPSPQPWLQLQRLVPCNHPCGHAVEPTTTSSSPRLTLVCFPRFFGPIYILTACFATGLREDNFIGKIQKLTSQAGTVLAQNRHSVNIIAQTERSWGH